VKYVEATRRIVATGKSKISKTVVIPSAWFTHLIGIGETVPDKVDWLIDKIGVLIPSGMPNDEAIESLAMLLYSRYPAWQVREIFKAVEDQLPFVCEICGRSRSSTTYKGWLMIGHFEKHATPPRHMNICRNCHSYMHNKGRKRRSRTR
jgi:hypothetical protein